MPGNGVTPCENPVPRVDFEISARRRGACPGRWRILRRLGAEKDGLFRRPLCCEPARPAVALAGIDREESRHLSASDRAFSDRGKFRFEPHELPELSQDFQRELHDLVIECQNGGSVVVLVTRESKIRRSRRRLHQIWSAGSTLYYQPYMSISALLDVKEEFNRVCREVSALTGAVLVDLAKRYRRRASISRTAAIAHRQPTGSSASASAKR